MTDTSCTTESALVGDKIVVLLQCLSLRDAIGLLVGAEAALLSLAATIIILGVICYKVWRKTLFPPALAMKQHLIQVPADLFMLALFVADLIQALGGVMDVKWVHDEKIYLGDFCNAQGAMQLLGEPAVALVTLVIALHTFSSVWWGRGIKSLVTAGIVIGAICLFIILYAGIGVGLNIHKLYITPTYWCWLGPSYIKEKISEEYFWLWLTFGLSLFFYLPLFFWSRGNITVDQEKWLSFRVHRSRDTAVHSEHRRHSLQLLLYPIVYSITIFPPTIVRFIEFSQASNGQQAQIPSEWVFLSLFTYRISGLLNVLLFVFIRRGLLLFGNEPLGSATGHAQGLPESSDDSLNGGETGGAENGGIPLGRLPDLEEAGPGQCQHCGNHRES